MSDHFTTPDDDRGTLLEELRVLVAELRRIEAQHPIVEVASEEGICYCPTCGAIVRVVPHHRRHPTVVDSDGRAHLCERYIAAVLARANVAGMRELRDRHLRSRPIASPLGPDGRPTDKPAAPDPSSRPFWEREPL